MKTIEEKSGSFGACSFERMSPAEMSSDTKAVNFIMPFEKALKLNVAIDECVRKLNSYNRAKTSGKNTGLRMVVHFDARRIRILEGKL